MFIVEILLKTEKQEEKIKVIHDLLTEKLLTVSFQGFFVGMHSFIRLDRDICLCMYIIWPFSHIIIILKYVFDSYLVLYRMNVP